MTEKAYIYQIKFNVHGYIGSTNNLRTRKASHLNLLRKNKHSNPILQKAFNKYGEENFKFEKIFECKLKDRNIVEEYFINKSDLDSSYNIMNNCKAPIKLYTSNGKLSKEDIIDIFKEANKGTPLKEIGNKYNINKENVRGIIFKQTYKFYSKNIDLNLQKYKKDRNKNKSKGQRKFFKRKLFVYSINGILLYEFNNVVEAVEKLNVTNSDIFNSISRKHQHKGMIFSRTRLNFSKYEPKWNTRKIIIFNEEFNRINDFNSMKECANFYEMNVNTINSNCNRMTLNTKLNLYFVRDNKLEVFKDKYSIKD